MAVGDYVIVEKVEVRDWDAVLEGYTKGARVSDEKIEQAVKDVNFYLRKHNWAKPLKFKVYVTRYKYANLNGLFIRTNLKNQYIIIADHDNVKGTLTHELGHMFRKMYVDLNKYCLYCYETIPILDGWSNSLEEEFAEDFKMYLTGQPKKTVRHYPKKFNAFAKLFRLHSIKARYPKGE